MVGLHADQLDARVSHETLEEIEQIGVPRLGLADEREGEPEVEFEPILYQL